MEKFSKVLSTLLLGAAAVSFSACSDDNNDDPIVSHDEELKNIVSTYVNDVVYPTYTALALHAETLSTACTNLYNKAASNTMEQSDIDAACEAFKDARVEWERSEAFLYGAAEDKDIDPHIDSWPLDQSEVKDVLTNATMVAALKGDDPVKYVRENNAKFQTALGFHGMEFVLFRNGANRTVAALNAYETMEGMESVKGIDELAFLAAVAGDLRDKCYQLEYCWEGSAANDSHAAWLKSNCTDIAADELVSAKGNCYGENMLATGTTNSNWGTWQENASNIFIGGCSNISQEVYSQKLGQAYRVATKQGTEEDAGDYIESPYSKRSFKDYQDNIYSIKNTLYGTRDIDATSPVSKSLLRFLQDNEYENASTLSSALNTAINTLEKAKNSGTAFVDDPGNAQVQDCINAVKALDDELIKAGNWIAKQ